MKARLLLVLFLAICTVSINAQLVQRSTHMVPTGKGFGVPVPAGSLPDIPFAVTQGNGINYHGGRIMPGSVHIYFIWYGNWTNGPKKSDTQTTVNLIDALYAASGGMGGSPYAKINSTYGDTTHQVSGNFSLVQSTTDNYSKGKSVSDAGIKAIVTSAINHGLPKDTNGIYFVLTSSDVNESSGFCSQYCGWHTHGTILSSDIKYAFVGNPDRCSSACEAQTVSPNGDSGADGMASIMAHETEEAVSDPDLNAWWNSNTGEENADQCAWRFGPLHGTLGHGAFNQTFGSHNWLIQMNWENARKGGCDQVKGGTFF